MKYLSAIFILVLGCGSADLGPKDHQEITNNEGSSEINPSARVNHDGPSTCPSSFEYFNLNGEVFEVEVPGLCTPYFGDRGDPPDANRNPDIIVERPVMAEHLQ